MSLLSANKVIELINETETLMKKQNHETNFQPFLSSLRETVHEMPSVIPTVQDRNRLKLCISQLLKALPSVVSSIKSRSTSKKAIINHQLEKIKWCLMQLLMLIQNDSSEYSLGPSGVFVQSIDKAINMVNIDSFYKLNFKELLDDLLCQALTIGKLSIEQDNLEISLTCKNVLFAMSKIYENPTLSHVLIKEQLLSSLENLERRVNVAVLRLVLHDLSHPWAPIKAMIKQCKVGLYQVCRKVADLETNISCLDLHSDRIHLIGNFAIACSENKKAILEVQSYLASLEFTENALVPSLISFYLDPENDKKREFLKYLTECWQSELIHFNTLVDEIIDPPAFSEVVLEDLTVLVDKLKDKVMDKCYDNSVLDIFFRRCNKLANHLRKVPDEKFQKDERLRKALKDLKYGLNSFKITKIQKLNAYNVSPIISQMEKILDHVSKISQILSDIVGVSYSVSNANFNSLQFPSSIRGLPLDISYNSQNGSCSENETSWLKRKFLNDAKGKKNNVEDEDLSPLKPYLERASLQRSTFYGKTPNRSTKIMHTRFDVSDILENLTGLADSFTSDDPILNLSVTPETSEQEESEHGFAKNSHPQETSKNKDFNSNTELNDISGHYTLQRIKDLKFVEKKIKFLKFKAE